MLNNHTVAFLVADVSGKGLNGISKLTLDFKNLEYVSSAGLRVILAAQKIMNKQGKMIIKNVNEIVSEVFEITGHLAFER